MERSSGRRDNPVDNSWREWKLPGDRPQAYAVFVDDQDMIWLSDFSANALTRFDLRKKPFKFLRCQALGLPYARSWAGPARYGEPSWVSINWLSSAPRGSKSIRR